MWTCGLIHELYLSHLGYLISFKSVFRSLHQPQSLIKVGRVQIEREREGKKELEGKKGERQEKRKKERKW